MSPTANFQYQQIIRTTITILLFHGVGANTGKTKSVSFVLNAKMVALSRENFFNDFDSSRRSLLVRSGIYYKKVGFEYNYHLIHDLNLSETDLVDKSLMLTLTF